VIGCSLNGGLTGHPRSDLGSNSGFFSDEPVFAKPPSDAFFSSVVGGFTLFSAVANVVDDATLDIATDAGTVFSPSGSAGHVTMSSTASDDVSASRSQRQSPWLSIRSSIAWAKIALSMHNFATFRGSLLRAIKF